MATRSKPSVIVGSREASQEVRDRFEEHIRQYRRATNLLKPDDVAGDYDAGRLLSTTLGGELRTITNQDLQTFKRTAESLGKKFTGGITARSLIDLSTREDRERSNTQIRVAVPTQHRGNDVHFITNAGPDSNVTRHHVHVQFLNLDSAIASPSRSPELTKTVAAGRIRIQCDCDHWRYRFSYIASIGKFNAGRPVDGYPKITNPRLIGVACKHVLRVAQQLSSPLVRDYIGKMIDRGRKDIAPKLVAQSKKDAVAMAQLQAKQGAWLRNTVETTTEKRMRLAQQRAVKSLAERSKKTLPKTPAAMASARRKFEQSARLLAAMGGISQKQLAAMLAKLKGA